MRFRRDQEIIRANHLAAERRYAVGTTIDIEGAWYRVTRHVVVPTTPQHTVIVYARPVRGGG